MILDCNPKSFRHAVLSALFVLIAPARSACAEPWRLSDALDAPDWLSLSGSYRFRYEGVASGFRPAQADGDHILAERFLLHARARLGVMYIGAELQDSRTRLDDESTPLGTDDVNAMELLQGYIGFADDDIITDGDRLDIMAGRMTLNIGSRRLAARNGFRNTINSFTGIHGVWTTASGWRADAFAVLPVERLPASPDRLRDNDIAFDNESFRTVFWGARLVRKNLFPGFEGEVYVFGLDERDGPRRRTANRELITPGFRLERTPARGSVDAGIEAAVQVGTVRASGATTDITDLDRIAGFVHSHIGYMFDAVWSPRTELHYDFASGDRDPADGNDNRFDTLFGSRGFEFGQTGIFGPLARANISLPGMLIAVSPSRRINASLRYRANWLAARRDALTTAGLRDSTGESGSFIGHLLEARLAYDVIPGNLRLEFGGIWLGDGRFLETAPAAPDNGAALFGYAQATISF